MTMLFKAPENKFAEIVTVNKYLDDKYPETEDIRARTVILSFRTRNNRLMDLCKRNTGKETVVEFPVFTLNNEQDLAYEVELLTKCVIKFGDIRGVSLYSTMVSEWNIMSVEQLIDCYNKKKVTTRKGLLEYCFENHIIDRGVFDSIEF